MAKADVQGVFRLHDLVVPLSVLFAEIAFEEGVLFAQLDHVFIQFDVLGCLQTARML